MYVWYIILTLFKKASSKKYLNLIILDMKISRYFSYRSRCQIKGN